MADTNEVDIYEAVIRDLESKIAALQMTIDNLRHVHAMSVGVGEPRKTRTEGERAKEFSNDAFFGMSIPDACKKYLGAIKRTASIPVIVEAILAGGLKSAATNMRENVRSILSRNTDFVRINGEFGLAEWYPGRKPAPRRKAQEQDNPAEERSVEGEATTDSPTVSNVLQLPA